MVFLKAFLISPWDEVTGAGRRGCFLEVFDFQLSNWEKKTGIFFPFPTLALDPSVLGNSRGQEIKLL